MKRLLFLLIIAILTFRGSCVSAQDLINTVRERIHLMGYAQAGYTYNDAAEVNNEFDIKRIIFMAEGKITDSWSLFFMYNFNGGGTLLEMYTDYHIIPGMSARLGQFKIPFTIESPLSPTVVELINCYSQATNYLAAISPIDPLIGSTTGRDLGFMLYGNLFNKHLTYHAGVVNGQGINNKDRNNNKDLIGSLMLTPARWLSIGGSFIKGKGHAIGVSEANPGIQVGDNYTRDRWAIGAVIGAGPVNLRTEYLGGKDGTVKSNGYYATASFRLCPEFDVIASYDYLNKNKELDLKQTNYVGGVQYWFYPRCRVQLQYTYSDIYRSACANMIQAQVQVRF